MLMCVDIYIYSSAYAYVYPCFCLRFLLSLFLNGDMHNLRESMCAYMCMCILPTDFDIAMRRLRHAPAVANEKAFVPNHRRRLPAQKCVSKCLNAREERRAMRNKAVIPAGVCRCKYLV